MAGKDYYLILGVSRGESPGGIRSAFRDLAREHHPDRAGPEGAPRFREVVEAYRVLSDPEKRRAYDTRLREQELEPRGDGSRIRWPGRNAFDEVELFGQPDSLRPSAEDLFDRILRNFLGRSAPKGEGPEPLLCDVALTAEEARRGGVLPVRIPIVAPCSRCHGMGQVAGFLCRRCDAGGEVSSELVVPLELPPGVRSGSILEMSLEPWGIRNLWLRARIGVGR